MFGLILVLSGTIMVLLRLVLLLFVVPVIRLPGFWRRYDSRTPENFYLLFVVPAMSRWSLSVVRVVAILHTNKK